MAMWDEETAGPYPMKVDYTGRDAQGRRQYKVDNTATVTCEDNDMWVYVCNCGQMNECLHVAAVEMSRVEAADDMMGDATP